VGAIKIAVATWTSPTRIIDACRCTREGRSSDAVGRLPFPVRRVSFFLSSPPRNTIGSAEYISKDLGCFCLFYLSHYPRAGCRGYFHNKARDDPVTLIPQCPSRFSFEDGMRNVTKRFARLWTRDLRDVKAKVKFPPAAWKFRECGNERLASSLSEIFRQEAWKQKAKRPISIIRINLGPACEWKVWWKSAGQKYNSRASERGNKTLHRSSGENFIGTWPEDYTRAYKDFSLASKWNVACSMLRNKSRSRRKAADAGLDDFRRSDTNKSSEWLKLIARGIVGS